MKIEHQKLFIEKGQANVGGKFNTFIMKLFNIQIYSITIEQAYMFELEKETGYTKAKKTLNRLKKR